MCSASSIIIPYNSRGVERSNKKGSGIWLFSGFGEGENDRLSYLQYVDDTLLVGKASIENLWAIKAVLMGFELVSGLKVNFHKSYLYEINVGI